MALSSQRKRTILQVFLAILIVVLTYILYISITGPYEAIEREQQLTQETRDRMDNIRTALVHYERQQDRFPHTLDTLGMYIDTAMLDQAEEHFRTGFDRDSLFYSPRSGDRFEYSVNDTGAVAIYLLEDPDSEDHIGAETPDPTLRNAASWE